MKNDLANGAKKHRRKIEYADFLASAFIALGLFVFFFRGAGVGAQLSGIVLIFLGCYGAYEIRTDEAKKELGHLFVKLLMISALCAFAYVAILEGRNELQARDCTLGGYIAAFFLFSLAGILIPGILLLLSFSSKEVEKNQGETGDGPYV